VLAVANKASEYDADDVAGVEQIASIAMELVARQRAEAALQESTRRSGRGAAHRAHGQLGI
jgi:GAF domain-containing protein